MHATVNSRARRYKPLHCAYADPPRQPVGEDGQNIETVAAARLLLTPFWRE